MQPLSARALALLRISHVVAFEANMLMPGDTTLYPCPLVGGQLAADRTALVRRSGQITVPVTAQAGDLDLRMLSFGGYVDLKRGVRFGDGTRELVQIGHLRCEAVSSQATAGELTVELADRMAQVEDEEFRAPYTATGKKAHQVITALITSVFGGTITYTDTTDPSEQPLMTDTIYESGRATAVADAAKSIGASAYFDPFGNFRLDPLPDPETAVSVWTVDGGEDGILIDMSESVDRSETVNGVLVRGQEDAKKPPISALVVDSAPASPLLWGGPFGKVLRIEESTAVKNDIQAGRAAKKILNSQLGLARSLQLTTVPNPALEPGDAIDVLLPGQESERHVVDALSFPIDSPGACEIATRTLYTGTALASLKPEELWTRRAFYGRDAWQEARAAELVA